MKKYRHTEKRRGEAAERRIMKASGATMEECRAWSEKCNDLLARMRRAAAEGNEELASQYGEEARVTYEIGPAKYGIKTREEKK